MKLRTSTVILMMLSGTALSQSLACTTLDDSPTDDEGMTQVSEGLYTQRTQDSESYLAVGPEGQQALLARLIELRAARPALANPGTGLIDGLIATLSQPEPQSVLAEQFGTCNALNMTGPLHARSLAGGGVGAGAMFGASSLAENRDGFSPPLNTTNVASAEEINRNGDIVRHQTTTTHGPNAPAAASALVILAAGCDADSSATVTCPGHITPSVSAFTSAHNQTCIRN